MSLVKGGLMYATQLFRTVAFRKHILFTSIFWKNKIGFEAFNQYQVIEMFILCSVLSYIRILFYVSLLTL